MRCVYDIETYPNVFTFGCILDPLGLSFMFEISDRVNEAKQLFVFLKYLVQNKTKMVGFNNYGFDYPIIHMFIESGGRMRAVDAYNLCNSIINSNDHKHSIPPWEHYIPQVDLYRIHHFNNRARATSLKTLEFNMRCDSVEDLPFPPGTTLNHEQIDTLKEYNLHDVQATLDFMNHSKNEIKLREDLNASMGVDFTNQSDVSIGVKIVVEALKKAGVQCYHYVDGQRQARGTERPIIHLKDCIFPWIRFKTPQFQTVLEFLKDQSITETKGVFKGLTADAFGMKFVFGLGGLHGSIDPIVIHSDNKGDLIDIDVKSYYPSIIITQGFYPEHLGAKFCPLYKEVRDARERYEKGTPENAAYKLALNGVYGQSGAPFSPFYDPQFMMKTTLNGQLLLCVLSESLSEIPSLRFVQANTDGLTIKVLPQFESQVRAVVAQWEDLTGLVMEWSRYRTMAIRDVNNYLAVYENGDVKKKGVYNTHPEWHKNHSALVVPKVAEMHLLHGAPIADTVRNWTDPMDFMLRAKVDRRYKLELHSEHGAQPQQRTCRYYISNTGRTLIKQMPPTPTMLKEGKDAWRAVNLQSGWNVKICNRIEQGQSFDINHGYYINEVEKLVLILC